MIIKFVSQAHSELIDAVEYYEGELSGLGHRFWDEVALAHQACRQGFSALYVRAPRLFEELNLCHADGSF